MVRAARGIGLTIAIVASLLLGVAAASYARAGTGEAPGGYAAVPVAR